MFSKLAPSQFVSSKDVEALALLSEEIEMDLKAADLEDSPGLLKIAVSDGTVDRHGDIVDPDGLDTKGYNGVMLWSHNQRDLPVGKAEKVYKRKKTWHAVERFIEKELNPLAWVVGKMYEKGYLHDSSIGFLPVEMKVSEDEDRRKQYWYPVDIKKSELLEISNVNVGSNRNANTSTKMIEMLRTAKEAGIETDGMKDLIERVAEEADDDLTRMRFKEVYAGFVEKSVTVVTPGIEIPGMGTKIGIDLESLRYKGAETVTVNVKDGTVDVKLWTPDVETYRQLLFGDK